MSSDSNRFTCRQAVRHILWASLAAPVLASAQNATGATADASLDEVLVTGYRASLELSAEAKRNAVSFTDSVFAEDIGKFPDLNLAESLQRIPGVQIQRDVTGEGTSVSIRGLGSSFTQMTLNGAPVETASDSAIDIAGGSQGRGIDLVLFPTELFSKLTVNKTPTAKQVEGAVAANVDLRIARPFDKKGFHVNYSAKVNYQETSGDWSPRLGVYASNTWETGVGEIGVLAGVAYSNRKYRTDGFNTFAYTTVSPSGSCPYTQAGCNPMNNGPGLAAQPGVLAYGNTSQAWATTVPVGYSFGANGANPGNALTLCGSGNTPGGTSGVSCNQLSYSLWPRLARPDVVIGERETQSAILSLQWAPSDNLSFYLDTLYSEANHTYERNDLNLAIRGTGENVPVNVVLDQNNVVTRATIANPRFLNENRPYVEDTDFTNINLGAEWKIGAKLTLNPSFNYNDSHWFRSTNTYMFSSRRNQGMTVDIENTGDGVYKITPSRSLNDPSLWIWDTVGALRIQPVMRDVWQKGGRIEAEYAFVDAFKLGVGVSEDKFHRVITSWDASNCATFGTGVGCQATLDAAGVKNAVVATGGSSGTDVTQPLVSYMDPWRHGRLYSNAAFDVGVSGGWSLPNYRALNSVLNMAYFENQLAMGLAAGADIAQWNLRVLDETTDAGYVEANGKFDLLGGLNYNAGVRYIKTDQTVKGTVTDPNISKRVLQSNDASYSQVLPSFNTSLDLGVNIIVRAAASRTLTRPAPGDIAPGDFLDTSGVTLTRGNPNLDPYLADNYDLGAEWYFDDSGLGVVALNLWKKNITGYTTVVATPNVRFGTLGIDQNSLTQSQYEGLCSTCTAQEKASRSVNISSSTLTVNQRQNTSERITLNGVELTYVQPLDFMLKGSGLSFNYTHIDQKSSGGLPGRPSSAIEGLASYTYNVTAFYENFGFSGRLSYSVRDTYVAFLGNNDQNVPGDNYAQKSGYLDAAFSYDLPLSFDLTVSLDMQNLTNERQRTYFRDNAASPRTAFAPGRQFLIGVSGKF